MIDMRNLTLPTIVVIATISIALAGKKEELRQEKENAVVSLCNVLRIRFSNIGPMILPIRKDHVQLLAESKKYKCKKLNSQKRFPEAIAIGVHIIIPMEVKVEDSNTTLDKAFDEAMKEYSKELEGVTHVGISWEFFDGNTRKKSKALYIKSGIIIQFTLVTVQEQEGNIGVLTLRNLEGSQLQGVRSRALDFHNEKRSHHAAAAITLDDKLNDLAQTLALQLATRGQLYEGNVMPARGGSRAFWSSINEVGEGNDVADFAFQQWYASVLIYNYKNPSGELSLFTQEPFVSMVWKPTERMGLGVAVRAIKTASGLIEYETYVAAKYLEECDINNIELLKTNVAPIQMKDPIYPTSEKDDGDKINTL